MEEITKEALKLFAKQAENILKDWEKSVIEEFEKKQS